MYVNELGQVESFRLVLSKGVDPNATDFNGNNVLHIMVIKDKIVRSIKKCKLKKLFWN